MEFSLFGEKFTRHAGITQLMDDLNQGLLNPTPSCWEAAIRPHPRHAGTLSGRGQYPLDNGELIKAMANYDGPRAKTGSPGRWPPCSARSWDGISARNIALTNGSQNAFFYLFNLLAGEFADGARRRCCSHWPPNTSAMPTQPALSDDHFVAYKPTIEKLPDGQFKYHVDFGEPAGGRRYRGDLCLPADQPHRQRAHRREIEHLDQIARDKDPRCSSTMPTASLPGIIFSDAKPFWNANTILCMSLSKLGLPAPVAASSSPTRRSSGPSPT